MITNNLEERIEKVETIYGYFFTWKDDAITNQLKKYSAHTRNELSMLGSLIKKGENIIDIGAHIGTFSIPFVRFNKGKGKIFSFEANPDNYKLLLENIRINKLNGKIIPTHAIVSTEKYSTFEMFMPQGGNSGMYYFQPISKPTTNIHEIGIINIDSWYKKLNSEIKIGLIKIDVEGAEVSVLNSCQELISQYKPILYIEISKPALHRNNHTTKDIEKILIPYGYRYFRNIGSRNSPNDIFEISELINIEEGGEFFDLLAIHPADNRYPPKRNLNKFSLLILKGKYFLRTIKNWASPNYNRIKP